MVNYVPEAVAAFARTWRIVRKEALWLERTRARLFSGAIDVAWVSGIDQDDDVAERVEAFASRYSRLQDTMGDKLFPRLLELVGQSGKSLIDRLNQLERIGLLQNAQDWLVWGNLRNRLIHEYVENPEAFAEALNAANDSACELAALVGAIQVWLASIGVDVDQAQVAGFHQGQ